MTPLHRVCKRRKPVIKIRSLARSAQRSVCWRGEVAPHRGKNRSVTKHSIKYGLLARRRRTQLRVVEKFFTRARDLFFNFADKKRHEFVVKIFYAE